VELHDGSTTFINILTALLESHIISC